MKYKKFHIPFHILIETDTALSDLRKEYSILSAKKRRFAAQWEYDSETAQHLFDSAIFMSGHTDKFNKPKWPPGFKALAIDPSFAPALLTVGSIEYQKGYKKEGMEYLLSLTRLKNEKELDEIIDKAGNFLLDNEDWNNALALYLSAEMNYPQKSIFYIGSGYCLSKLKRYKESVEKNRKAVELDPTNYYHLNDLGYSLLEAKEYGEAEIVLRRAIELSPEDYDFPKNNLKLIIEKKMALTRQ
ncbi:MAG: tetratricopeptide repeat protein [Syntrophaceae bacterium]|nr:tetratricopeptide repeat protein [Syntrophaceae bacterium]